MRGHPVLTKPNEVVLGYGLCGVICDHRPNALLANVFLNV